MPSAPSASPLSNAAIVFSGASALPPRCAKTSGRDAAKKGWRSSDRIESMAAIHTLGELRQSGYRSRPVKHEIRDNLVCKLRTGEALFPGIIGYDETVIPQLVNAILSRHNFILLGLRGQAKSRILRGLVDLLDEKIPVVPGCEIHDDPLAPLCAGCRARVATEGDELAIGWLPRDLRYVEKLATPDVTIADMVGDIDPIKAAQAGLNLS